MKRIIIFLSMALFLSYGVNAQTLSTDTFSDANGNMPAVGANFNVPIDVASIGDVFTLTIYLEYDVNVLTYTGFANNTLNLNVTEPVAGVLKILVDDFPAITTVPDGTLLDLQFDFDGGYTALTFQTFEYGTYKSSILETDYSTFYFHDADVTNGAVEGFFENTITGGDWDDVANWSLGSIPDEHHKVTVDVGSEVTAAGTASAMSVVVNPEAQFTLTGTLNVTGDFTIKSDATGDGSYINNGGTLTVGGTTTVERYAVNGQWHGLSSPVIGATFATTYFGGNPKVWVKEYNEPTNDYTYLTDITAPMGDMTGYFTWIQTSGTPQTYTFEGGLRTGTVTSGLLNLTNTGHAFLGNPYTSAIDWDAPSGWTKFHLNDAIYVYDGAAGQWMSYVGGTGANGGSNYIPMGQGFFVQVDNNFTFGSVDMTNAVCVHNAVAYKSSQDNVVRLQVEDAGNVDETVIRFTDDATTDFDGNLDAHKMFSFKEDYPQIYSTANDFMSINSLPYNNNVIVNLDVRGKDGNSMTIKATEFGDEDHVYLKDNFTGVITDLKSGDYTFTYKSQVSDRFQLFFGITGVDSPTADDANIYAVGNTVTVVLNGAINADIAVYNLLGQRVASKVSTGTRTNIDVERTGYYLVKVNDGTHITTKKVFVN